jgi:hypothetical protein
MVPRPDRDADLDMESRETRRLCSKVGAPEADRVSSSVELEPRRLTLVDCRRLSVEPVLSLGNLPRASRRFVWVTAGEELATMVDSAGELAGAVLVVPGGLLDGTCGVDAKLLRLDVALGARGYPRSVLAFRDLVLYAGGEDWKLGVDSSPGKVGSTEGATCGNGSARPQVGLVSGMASPFDIASVSNCRAKCDADFVDDRGSSGTALGAGSAVGAASSSTSD